MYVSYTEITGWSNATIISNDGTKWNNEGSTYPSIAVEDNETIHVVWNDFTPGVWGEGIFDPEIMYASYIDGLGWSNATVISDGYNGFFWNNDNSVYADIAVDKSSKIHVVWQDNTDGIWGIDDEIMYVSYTEITGWSNVIIIFDDNTEWNTGTSSNPAIAIDNSNKIHIIWDDNTEGIWGVDFEIMYISIEQNIYHINDDFLILFVSITVLSASGISIFFGAIFLNNKGLLRKIKKIPRKHIPDIIMGDDRNHNTLLELSQKENLIEHLLNQKGLYWTAFDEQFIEIIEHYQWDYNENIEFLRELATLKTRERKKFIKELLDKMRT